MRAKTRIRSSRPSAGIVSVISRSVTIDEPVDETLRPEQLSEPEDLGRALTRLRLRAGLTVREVADSADQRHGTVGGYFSGRHLPLQNRPQVLSGLLKALGVPASEHTA